MADAEPLRGLAEARRQFPERGPAPVHLWNPPFCGDIDMRIARDGTWFYRGTPIGRPALVKLFASILRKDLERYVLVTPVEKVGITVEDAPFLGVAFEREGEDETQVLTLRTNVDDFVKISEKNPLRFEPGASEGRKPLRARARRPLGFGQARPVLRSRAMGHPPRNRRARNFSASGRRAPSSRWPPCATSRTFM